MKKAAEEHASEDKNRKEEVETRNQADNLIFQSKKQLQEFGDKIPADKKKPLEDAIQKLEGLVKTAPLSQLKSEIENLNKVWSEAATYMYQQAQVISTGWPTESGPTRIRPAWPEPGFGRSEDRGEC